MPRARARAKGEKVTPYVTQEQRVAIVYRWLRDGLPRSSIMQAAAKEAADESKAIASAVAQKVAHREAGDHKAADSVIVPLRIWSRDDDTQMPTRTLDRYISLAKQRYADEQEEVSKGRQWVSGQQHARLNALLNKALTDKDYDTALDVVQEQNKLHGLYPKQQLDVNVNTIQLGELAALFSNMSVVVSEEVTDADALARIEARWSSLFRQAFKDAAPMDDANDITHLAAQPRLTSGNA